MTVENEQGAIRRRRGQIIVLGVAVFVLLGANLGALAGMQLQGALDGAVSSPSEVAAGPAGPPAGPDPAVLTTRPARRNRQQTPAPAAVETNPQPQPAATEPAQPAPQTQGQPTSEAPPQPDLPAVPADPSLVPFSGLSTWIDVYDTELTPQQQVDIAAAGGVQTIFVQSGKYNSRPIQFPRRLSVVIERAHDYGMKVMVWYVPDFRRPQRDFQRSTLAMSFTTPRGDHADAFGLDIEVEKLRDTGKRTQRLLELSESLRSWAGPDYPMAAIVLPPLQLDLRPSWWPNFPYAGLVPYYDVFIPMSYSSFRGTDAQTTYEWNLNNVLEMRRRAGNPSLPVHLAGGIADNLPRLGAFIRAATDGDVLGAGLYDLHTTDPRDWPTLQRLRAEAPG